VEFYNKYRDLTLPVSIGLAADGAGFGIFGMVRKPKAPDGGRSGSNRSCRKVPTRPILLCRARKARGAPRTFGQSPTAGGVPQLSEGDRDQLADRIRQVAKRDPAATANVLRMWLQDKQS
jgi:flagellar biosynthesis/type III secretory pathway M-ring protein FliF/YscJ